MKRLKTKTIVTIICGAVVILGIGAWIFLSRQATPQTSQTTNSANDEAVARIDLHLPSSGLRLSSDDLFLKVTIDTEDDQQITWVEYLLDEKVIERITEPPFNATIDLTGIDPGEHTLQAIAYDTAGNKSESEIITFVIDLEDKRSNSTEAPLSAVILTHTQQPALQSTNNDTDNRAPDTSGGNNGGSGSVGGGEDEEPSNPPITPLAQVCGNDDILENGPTTPPPGAFIVPAGDNESLNLHQANTTYWFAPGIHTLGTTLFGQIIPGDNSTYIGAPGAILDGQNMNLLAFTQHAENVTIRHLEIRNFGTGASNNDEGVVNHDSGENWTIEYNYIHDNDGAGVFIGTGSKIAYNCLKDNGQYGFSSYHPDGVSDVILDHNEVTGNNQDDWETLREGCGCTGGGKFWETHGAVVTNNWVHDNMGTGLWADFNNTNFLFENNYIEENDGLGLFYEISYNFMIRDNTFMRNAVVDGKDRATRGDPFPSGAIYISESGGDIRAGSQYAQSEIVGNYFEDNWDGVVLWENADRFCRPEEESDTTNNCPFFDDTWGTRFKTQNIKIHENEFRVDRDAIDCTNDYCARNAMFSNYGSWPPTSPYKGTVIQEAITYSQNNQWTNNTYVGPWFFTPYEMSTHRTFSEWRASPYNQDTGSTIQ